MMNAARAGMENTGRMEHMTLREIQREMEAFAAARRLEAERMDIAAWLTGRYVLTALHAPRRFPARPNGMIRRPREMGQDEMKRIFISIAERRTKDGGC